MDDLLKKADFYDYITLPNGAVVDIDVFKHKFKEVPTNPTYDDFVRIDDGKLGYKDFFNELKEKGILN